MSSFLEAMVLLLPPEVGGRVQPVAPREGSYSPFARFGEQVLRIRVIEGPPRLAPGEGARVVLECDADHELRGGEELQLMELDEVVGHVTVLRVLRAACV